MRGEETDEGGRGQKGSNGKVKSEQLKEGSEKGGGTGERKRGEGEREGGRGERGRGGEGERGKGGEGEMREVKRERS